jgi:hypothetical protein
MMHREPAVADAVYVVVATPEAFVNAAPGATAPHPVPVTVKVTSSVGTGAPPDVVTVAVMGAVPLTVTDAGAATTTLLLAVCVTTPAVPFLIPPLASIAVMEQVPGVALAVYANVAVPPVTVTPVVGLSVPQEPATEGTATRLIGSPTTVAGVKVTVTVPEPPTCTLEEFTATAVAAVPLWLSITVDPVCAAVSPVCAAASVAVMVQKPLAATGAS